MKRCKKCGQLENEFTKFCTSCGSSMKDAEVVNQEVKATCCPNCGKPANDTYCQHCGALVDENNTDKTNSQKGSSFVSGTMKAKKKQNYLVPIIGVLFVGVIVVFSLIAKGRINPTTKEDNEETETALAECVNWVHYTEDGRVGFKDLDGNIELEAKYINAGNFTSEGLAKVVGENHLWGYIDYNGKLVIKSQFENVGDFSDGLARVYADGQVGYINTKGEFVIKPQFDEAGDFCYGLAMVYVDGKAGYITENGNFAIKPEFDKAGNFSFDNLAPVCTKSDEGNLLYGYINDKGKYVTGLRYTEAYDFNDNGVALVHDYNTYTYPSYGYINTKGLYIDKPEFKYAHNFQDNGLAIVGIETYAEEYVPEENATNVIDVPLYGYVDNMINYVIEPEFLEAGEFQKNGLARVAVATEDLDNLDFDEIYDADAIDREYGFINKNGTFVIEPQFNYAGEFQDNGLAVAYDEDTESYGYINETGAYKIAPCFESAYDFQANGLALVCDKDTQEYGYINELGSYVIEPQFSCVDNFQDNGLALVYDEDLDKYGYIDAAGEYVIDLQFDNLHTFQNNGLALVYDEDLDKYGYINATGEYVIKPQFDSISSDFQDNDNGLAEVVLDDNYIYINAKGEQVDIEED